MINCSACNAQISPEALNCPHCGQPSPTKPVGSVSPRTRTVAFLLCFFFGCIGVHRFYAGKIITGILQIVTLGGLGIWALVDFILILCGSFKDKEGRAISRW